MLVSQEKMSIDSDYKSLWDKIMYNLRQELGEEVFGVWFGQLAYLEASENKISVSVPSNFFKERFSKEYSSRIEKKLNELTGKDLSISLEIAGSNGTNPEKSVNRASETHKPSEKQAVSGISGSEPSLSSKNSADTQKTKPAVAKEMHPQLQEEYTFETFIVSEDNTFAFNAAKAVASNPGTFKNYNPLLIYGGTGLGKTHLMQAIGHSIHQDRDLKILYITGEGFMRDFVEYTLEKKMKDFAKKYRYVDVLLIDDIHTIERGAGTQDELFYTFEELYKKKKQMIFTCDRPISELKNMAPRLQSRFQWGLQIDLKPPNYETRLAILKKKIENRNVFIPDEVLSLISKNISSNVRDLEGALNKLMAYADLVNKPITMETAQKELIDMFASQKQGNLPVENIQRVVANYFNLSLIDIKGKKRNKGIVRARHIAMYLVRKMTEYSLTEIGDIFGGKDHTTVISALEKIENEIQTDTSLYSLLQELERTVKESGTKSG